LVGLELANQRWGDVDFAVFALLRADWDSLPLFSAWVWLKGTDEGGGGWMVLARKHGGRKADGGRGLKL